MFSQLRMREEQALLAQDYALETARAEGIEQGLERGRAEGIEEGIKSRSSKSRSSRPSDFRDCKSTTGYDCR